MIRGRMFLMRPSLKRESREFVVRNATDRRHVWISRRLFIDSVSIAIEPIRKRERRRVLFFAENVTLRDSDPHVLLGKGERECTLDQGGVL
jgi:hypothetical protein